ncbi:MAG TPA: galactokinase [Bacteroidales bacterium]|nr:galactokinase [Bacteroidales bacterium]HRT88777.1 galactokinase [Bacteroidales bacterium]
MRNIIERMLESFYGKYGDRNSKPVLFFSPGRVNLIGEHTDYNGGFVFPCALNFGTYLMIRNNGGKNIRFSTLNFTEEHSVPVKEEYKRIERSWVNYPLGVINEFAKLGYLLPGSDLLFYGDVPNGAGLSSSASIEMVTACAVNEITGAGLALIDLVKLSQKAENIFVGMNCGIMDQFASGFGKKDHAIFLNCDTLDYENVPLILGDYSLIITNTNKRRGLTDSKYNERRAECDKAVEYLQAYRKIRNLSETGTDELALLNKYIPDEIVLKRARHVITENGRVLEAVKVLKENNIARFGELMNQSHDSLRGDYEVTGIELDTLVYEGRKIAGVLGTRMTGAGFGGCTVSIVHKDHVEEYINTITEAYTRKTGLNADFYQPSVGNGSGRIEF